jgi:hypothetical protein
MTQINLFLFPCLTRVNTHYSGVELLKWVIPVTSYIHWSFVYNHQFTWVMKCPNNFASYYPAAWAKVAPNQAEE